MYVNEDNTQLQGLMVIGQVVRDVIGIRIRLIKDTSLDRVEILPLILKEC